MQYGVDCAPYRRVKNEDIKNGKNTIRMEKHIEFIIYIVVAFLISRVFLINLMAPFGIAFISAVCREKRLKICIVSGVGVMLGYLSLYQSSIPCFTVYLIITVSLVILLSIFNKLKNINKFFVFFVAIFIELAAYKIIVLGAYPVFSIFNSIFETLCILSIHLVIRYGILSIDRVGKNGDKFILFREEIISFAIIIALIISGTWGMNIFGVSLRNILALTFIVMISYIKGSSFGAAFGAAMGLVTGMSNSNMIVFIGVYAFCGLIPGMFKDTNKIFSALSFLLSFGIIKLYSGIGSEFKVFEAIISIAIFLLISEKYYERLSLELDWDKQRRNFNEGYSDKIKGEFLGRLSNFTGVLYNMSSELNVSTNNDKLTEKNRSSFLIEGLADRVCKNCSLHSSCWKREIYYTYSAFGELIQSYQEKRKIIPQELNKKCIRKDMLHKNTDELVNSYIIEEMCKNKMNEGKNLLASQITNMANSLDNIVDEINTSVFFDEEIEIDIRRLLDKNRIKYEDILCMKNKTGRLTIKAKFEACEGKQRCHKEIIPLINSALNKYMCVQTDSCTVDKKTGKCNITFEETPKYYVITHNASKSKHNEKISGDSNSFIKLPDGSFMILICDGMGSGPQAGAESETAVTLIERFTRAGFSKEAAINSVNSIMTLKSTSAENFSTVDLTSIDLYTGETSFIKIGAVDSFLKRGKDVTTISSKTLPIGVLDKVDMDIVKKKIKSGDIIVMISDGVVDSEGKNEVDSAWIVEYLENATSGNPREIAEDILSAAFKKANNKPKDDMTVIVSKVFNLY